LIIQPPQPIECLYISGNIKEYLGISAEAISLHPELLFEGMDASTKNELFHLAGKGFLGLDHIEREFKNSMPDASEKWLKLTATPRQRSAGRLVWNIILTDISGRKNDEATLLKFNRELRFRNIVTDKLILLTELNDVYDTVCQSLVQDGNYILACIYHMPDGEAIKALLKPRSSFGRTDYLNEIRINLSDEGLNHGPTAIALMKRETVVVNHFSVTDMTKPWWDKAKKYNIAASISIPLQMPENRAGAIIIYSENINAFDLHEVEILERIAENISLFTQNIHHKKRPRNQVIFSMKESRN